MKDINVNIDELIQLEEEFKALKLVILGFEDKRIVNLAQLTADIRRLRKALEATTNGTVNEF